jgi:ribonuclease D
MLRSMTNPDTDLYINTSSDLIRLCDRLREHTWLAIDTEFLREKTYFPRLCLVQIATPDLVACIDPLALDDLGPLLDLLYDPAITKVMHACRQDMEIFHHLRGAPPGPVFDTQLAAPLLGHPEQMGYAALVADLTGVHLSKSHTRTDWSRRPLSREQLHYAGDDVRYLVKVYETLRESLQRRGRLDWLDEDFAALSDPALYDSPPESAWKSVRAGRKLRSAERAVLQALAAWRETTARAEDLPRGWVLRDDDLVQLTRMKPKSADDLAQLRGLPPRTLKRHAAQLIEIIQQARSRPAPPADEGERPAALTLKQEALVDALTALVRLRSAEHDIHTTQLAGRKALEDLVRGARDAEVLHGWRRRLIGDDLLALLNGERALVISAEGVKLEARE